MDSKTQMADGQQPERQFYVVFYHQEGVPDDAAGTEGAIASLHFGIASEEEARKQVDKLYTYLGWSPVLDSKEGQSEEMRAFLQKIVDEHERIVETNPGSPEEDASPQTMLEILMANVLLHGVRYGRANRLPKPHEH